MSALFIFLTRFEFAVDSATYSAAVASAPGRSLWMQMEKGLHLPPLSAWPNSGMWTSPPPCAKLLLNSATFRARSALSCGVIFLLCAGGISAPSLLYS